MPPSASRPQLTPGVDPGALTDALAWARRAYRACDVCAARCGVDRYVGAAGRCGLGAEARVYKEYLHLGEEQALVPSHTIYMTGCNLRCVFCSDDGPVRRPLEHGVVATPRALAARIALRRRQGATNVNFVGGLPDVNVLAILETLALCPPDTHVVWNTNLWTTEEAVERLGGVVGTWLVDYKFGDDRCALRLSGTRGYLATLDARLAQLALSRGGDRLIVRHLVMPGHLECCTRPALAHIARVAPRATVNLMTGYHPFHLGGRALGGAARHLGRVLSDAERARVRALARDLARRHGMEAGSRVWLDGVPADGT